MEVAESTQWLWEKENCKLTARNEGQSKRNVPGNEIISHKNQGSGPYMPTVDTLLISIQMTDDCCDAGVGASICPISVLKLDTVRFIMFKILAGNNSGVLFESYCEHADLDSHGVQRRSELRHTFFDRPSRSSQCNKPPSDHETLSEHLLLVLLVASSQEFGSLGCWTPNLDHVFSLTSQFLD